LWIPSKGSKATRGDNPAFRQLKFLKAAKKFLVNKLGKIKIIDW